MIDIFLVNTEFPGAEGLVKKLSGPHEPGAIVMLTAEEMQCFTEGGVERITSTQGVPQLREKSPESSGNRGRVNTSMLGDLVTLGEWDSSVIETK